MKLYELSTNYKQLVNMCENAEDNDLWFNGHTPTEGDEYSFSANEIDTYALALIADTISE